MRQLLLNFLISRHFSHRGPSVPNLITARHQFNIPPMSRHKIRTSDDAHISRTRAYEATDSRSCQVTILVELFGLHSLSFFFYFYFSCFLNSIGLGVNRTHGLGLVVKPHRALIVTSTSACQTLDFFRRTRVAGGNHMSLRQLTPKAPIGTQDKGPRSRARLRNLISIPVVTAPSSALNSNNKVVNQIFVPHAHSV